MLKKTHDSKSFYDASVGSVNYEYLNSHILDKSELSLHNKIELERFLRNLGSLECKRNLVKYVSNILECPAFILDEDSNLFVVSGYSSYVFRNEMFGEELHSLLTFLDNPEYVQKVLSDNFTLYPICFCFDFELEDKVVNSLCVVSVSLNGMVFGVIGKIDINFDLVIPVLKHISEKAI